MAAKPCPLPAAPALLRGTRGQWRDRFAPPFAERAGGEGELQGGEPPRTDPEGERVPCAPGLQHLYVSVGFCL